MPCIRTYYGDPCKASGFHRFGFPSLALLHSSHLGGPPNKLRPVTKERRWGCGLTFQMAGKERVPTLFLQMHWPITRDLDQKVSESRELRPGAG